MSSFFHNFFNLLFFFGALQVLSLNLGPMPGPQARFFGLVFLVGLFLVNFKTEHGHGAGGAGANNFGRRGKWVWLGLSLVILGLGLLFFVLQPVWWLWSMSLIMAGLWWILSSREENNLLNCQIYLLTVTALVYSLLFIFHLFYPHGWYLLREISFVLSKTLGQLLLSRSILIGPTASGIWISVTFGLYAALYLLNHRAGWPRWLITYGLFMITHIGFLFLQHKLGFIYRSGAYSIMHTQVIFLVMCSLVSALLLPIKGGQNNLTEVSKPDWRLLVPLGLAGFLLGLGLTYPLPIIQRSLQTDQQPKVVLLNEGYVDWKVPVFGIYGPYQIGLFGNLPEYLALLGYSTELASRPLQPFALEGARVVVALNSQQRWTEDELALIWHFVEEGGSLLVMGDHTNLLETSDSLNQLLSPVPIRLQFDSGYPCREAWVASEQFLPHPITEGVNWAHQALISVGASLSVKSPAFPLVVGKYGFSDLGNILNKAGAYLGNYAYEQGEQLGDIILAAYTPYGRGKVLVFGDTSPLQNTAFCYDLVPFVSKMFRWLVNDSPVTRKRGYGLFLLWLGLVIVGGVLIRLYRKPQAILIIILFFGLGILTGEGLKYCLRTPLHFQKGEAAVIDISHQERISLAALQNNSIGGIITNLLRNKYLPLMLEDFSASWWQQAKVLVLIAPTRGFTPREVRKIDHFIKQGGLVILSVGYPDKEGSQALLDHYQMDIAGMPLGPVPVVRTERWKAARPQFISAWPLVDAQWQAEEKMPEGFADELPPLVPLNPPGPWPAKPNFIPERTDPAGRLRGEESAYFSWPKSSPEADDWIQRLGQAVAKEGCEVLYQTEGIPTAIFKRSGRGALVVISDTNFLGDENIENFRYYQEGNILFLKEIFERFRKLGLRAS